jgi:hypothetical protein
MSSTPRVSPKENDRVDKILAPRQDARSDHILFLAPVRSNIRLNPSLLRTSSLVRARKLSCVRANAHGFSVAVVVTWREDAAHLNMPSRQWSGDPAQRKGEV